MKRIKAENESARKITRTGGYSYYVTLPKQELDELGWREGQSVSVTRRGRSLIIEKEK